MSDDDPIDRDPRLVAALRHAPDAEVEPPAAIGAALRQAARAQPAPPTESGWRRLLGWIDPARHPARTGALACAVLASVVIALWRGEEVPPARNPAPASTAADEAARQAPIAPASPGDRASPSAVAKARAPRPAVGASERPAQKAEEPGSLAQAEQRREAAPAPPAATPAPAEPNAASVFMTPASEAATPAAAAAPAPEGRSAVELAERRARMSDAAQAQPTIGTAGRPASPPGLARLILEFDRLPADAGASTPAGGLGWRWRSQTAAPSPAGAQAREWLTRLQAATRGAWQPIPGPAHATASVVFSREGEAPIQITLQNDQIIWADGQGRWSATVAPETIESLRR